MAHLIADVGGTNARFAIVNTDLEISQIGVLPTSDYPSLQAAAKAFLESVNVSAISGACFAIAAPINTPVIEFTNNHWHFTRDELSGELGCEVMLINDFTAQIYALDHPDAAIDRWFGEVRPSGNKEGCKAVLGAGTGLGMAARVGQGEVVDSEWGHISFAPVDGHQAELLSTLWQRYSRVSVERLLSGEGISNLYWANSVIVGAPKKAKPAEISKMAAEGDLLAIKAIGDFLDVYADVAGDVALGVGADQGVYISGGIMPKIQQFLDPTRFRRRFEAKGRFSAYNAEIPLAIVAGKEPGLMGSAVYLMSHIK